jgi:hypothetical protein
LGLCLRRDRIHLGGIDEIYAEGYGPVELFMGVSLGILFTERHGAKAEPTDFDVGIAKLSHLHGSLPMGLENYSRHSSESMKATANAEA